MPQNDNKKGAASKTQNHVITCNVVAKTILTLPKNLSSAQE